jgi:hypothetical protein
MSDVRMVTIDEGRFETLVDIRRRVNEALARFNGSKEQAKSDGKTYEAARAEFEREFDRLVRAAHGEDLPLFANQTDAIEAAKSDPVVTKLLERLLGRGHDVNALIVAGYTEEERNEVAKYLDVMDRNDEKIAAVAGTEQVAEVEPVDVPAFLTPQPLTAIEQADFIARCKAASDLILTAKDVEGWSQAQIAEARDYLAKVDAIKAEKGADLTLDDMPEAPDFLCEQSDANELAAEADDDEDGEADREASSESDDDSDGPAMTPEVEDEPQPENLPAPARGRSRRKLQHAGA